MGLEVQNQQLQQAHFSSKRGVVTVFRPTTPITFRLFHHSHHFSASVDLEEPTPLPLGWQKFLNLQTGEIYYSKTGKKELINLEEGKNMNGRDGPRLDLKLNLSPPTMLNNPMVESPTRSLTVSPTSPPSSCVSSELNQDEFLQYSTSPETTSMMLVGCPRCLMYVMLAEEDPRCPKCKSTVLLDVFHDNNAIINTSLIFFLFNWSLPFPSKHRKCIWYSSGVWCL